MLASNSNDSNDGYIGGGEVLEYYNQSQQEDAYDKMNESLMHQLSALPYVKYVIIGLLIVVAVLLVMRLMQIRVTRKGRGAAKELERLGKLRKEEARDIKVRNGINVITGIVNKSPLRLDIARKKELQYKLGRADIRDYGGLDIMSAETFNALIVAGQALVGACALMIFIFVNMTVGMLLFILNLVATNTIVELIVSSRVAERDDEIHENFTSLYMMLHHMLMRNPNASIRNSLRSYGKTTESKEMKKFTDRCIHFIDTYGDVKAADYISEEYKRVDEIVKLMGIIKQAGNGGDIKAELQGFRLEQLRVEEIRMEKRKERALKKLRIPDLIVMALLVQGVISATLIYLDDFTSSISMFGN